MTQKTPDHIAILEFDLSTQEGYAAFEEAVNAPRCARALRDLETALRNKVKYETKLPEQDRACFEQARKMLHEACAEAEYRILE